MRKFRTLQQTLLNAATHLLCLVPQTTGVRVMKIKFGPGQGPRLKWAIGARHLGAAPVVRQLEDLQSVAQTAAQLIISLILRSEEISAHLNLAFGARNDGIILQILQSSDQSRESATVSVVEHELTLNIHPLLVEMRSTGQDFDWGNSENELTQLQGVDAKVQEYGAAKGAIADAFHVTQAKAVLDLNLSDLSDDIST